MRLPKIQSPVEISKVPGILGVSFSIIFSGTQKNPILGILLGIFTKDFVWFTYTLVLGMFMDPRGLRETAGYVRLVLTKTFEVILL